MAHVIPDPARPDAEASGDDLAERVLELEHVLSKWLGHQHFVAHQTQHFACEMRDRIDPLVDVGESATAESVPPPSDIMAKQVGPAVPHLLAARARAWVADVLEVADAVHRICAQFDEFEAQRSTLLGAWDTDPSDEDFCAVGEALGIEFAHSAFVVMGEWLDARHGSLWPEGRPVPTPHELHVDAARRGLIRDADRAGAAAGSDDTQPAGAARIE